MSSRAGQAVPAGSESGSGLEKVVGREASAFRRRIGLGAFGAIVLLVLLGSLLAWRQYEDAKRDALTGMHARVVLASTVFDTYFAGQLAALNSIASAPSVVGTDTAAMGRYFARLQDGKQMLFTGGLGWIDRTGVSRVSGTNPQGSRLNISDRSFFRMVVSTGRPFISEGVTTRVGQKRAIVMAVPTRDARGRLTGVLAGALELRASGNDQRATNLGFGGLVVIDRAGQQITLTSFARPANEALLAKLRQGDGVLADTQGLDGSGERAVAFANSKTAGWTSVIDRPRSAVFASAESSLRLELASVGGAALVVLAIVGWAIFRARRGMEAEREHVRRLDELSQSLGEASAAAEVSAALGAALASAFPQAWAIIALEEEDGRALRIWTFEPGAVAPFDGGDPTVTALARLAFDSGEPVRQTDSEAVRDTVERLGPPFGAQPGSLFALPLKASSGRAIGSVTLVLPADGTLDDADETLVSVHVDQAARALARARRYERDHDVAVALQRSLLPEALPAVEGLGLAGRYNAGGVGLEVGGDWYDAVRRPDGILHLTVGDVAGRGIPAAVLMAQLRNAFRALAYEHTSPAEIARRLTSLVPDAGMATAVFLTLDPYTGELRYTSAGHPPSILLDALSGAVTSLDQASAPPLGWAEPHSIVEARLVLPSRMTLLAYTDGLVERRGTGIDEGIARLTRLLGERPELPADETADRLLETMVAPLTATDDIALLLVQISEVPATMRIEIPSDPTLMRGLRARLRAWLARRGVGEEQQLDTILALSEACNNAIEHAYEHDEGIIRLTLEHTAGTLRISIEDEGTWRVPRPDPTRGRGMVIMNGTMDTAQIAPGAKGTRVDLELRLPAGRQA